MNLRKIVMVGAVAAVYFVLTVTLGDIGYGPLQFRLGEILNILAFIHPVYILGVGLGCAFANFFSFGLIDVFVGSLSTVAAMSLMWRFRKHETLASLLPAVFTFPVALEMYLLGIAPLWLTYGSLFVSQMVIVSLLGLRLLKLLRKNEEFIEILSFERKS